MNKFTETELAYLAGFFDGEGCINISRSVKKTKPHHSPGYSLQVVISQNDHDLLAEWQAKMNLGSIQCRDMSEVGYGITYAWHITAKQAMGFLRTLLPYLRLKKEQAELAISFQENIGRHNQYNMTNDVLENRETIYKRLQEMKGTSGQRGRKGSSDGEIRTIMDINERKRKAFVRIVSSH